jgi:hypothetical protein
VTRHHLRRKVGKERWRSALNGTQETEGVCGQEGPSVTERLLYLLNIDHVNMVPIQK